MRRLSVTVAAVLAEAQAAAQVPWYPSAPENRQVLPTFNYAISR